MDLPSAAFWSIPASALLQQLEAIAQGLTTEDAPQRLERFGANRRESSKRTDRLTLFLQQFKSPIVLTLLFAASLSCFLDDPADAISILAIILASATLGFWQDYSAANAVQTWLAIVQIKATALRDGSPQEIPVEDIVPGDSILLRAGEVIPGACRLLEGRDLCVDEEAFTGETVPVEKMVGSLTAATPLGQRPNVLFLGTHVVSGTGTAVAVHTGKDPEVGQVSQRLRLKPPETEFERGVRRFGSFLMEVTVLLVMAIVAVNVCLDRPVLDSFLFSLALAVGLTPQLVPAIISLNLAHGAKRMAEHKVIVRRLAVIENFGSMNVLCSDKPGTLTAGVVRVQTALSHVLDACATVETATGGSADLDTCRQHTHRSRPSGHLLLATLLTVGVTLPYTPLGEIFEFRPLPVSFLPVLGLIVGLYTVAAEFTKKAFYRRLRF